MTNQLIFEIRVSQEVLEGERGRAGERYAVYNQKALLRLTNDAFDIRPLVLTFRDRKDVLDHRVLWTFEASSFTFDEYGGLKFSNFPTYVRLIDEDGKEKPAPGFELSGAARVNAPGKSS